MKYPSRQNLRQNALQKTINAPRLFIPYILSNYNHKSQSILLKNLLSGGN